MPFTTEMEMLHILMEQSQGTIGAQDILSIQRVTTKDPMYIVYCDNSSTKAKILECVCVEVEGREYELIDFQTKNITTFGSSGSRVSIHGIPFHVTDEDIQVWIDGWASRSSAVRKARVKPKDDPGHNLLNGNRFCYVTSIKKRYSQFYMTDPLNPSSTVEIQITVYYDDQPINCRRCMADHDTRDCPVFARKPAAPQHMLRPNIEPFRGGKHPLSNYFPADISVGDVTYPTAEHYYQHAKAMSLGLPDEADEIRHADTPYKAMMLGNDLDNLVSAAEIDLWQDQKVEVMRSTLDFKYHARKS